MDTRHPSKEEFHAQVEQRANALFIRRGSSPGNALSDWLEAEKQIREEYEKADRLEAEMQVREDYDNVDEMSGLDMRTD
jgi:hypothetical protein